jgi:hypothetical protein
MDDDAAEWSLLPCPVCGRETDSLKQYRYVSWCVFFLAGAIWQPVIYRACPVCMRRFLWKKCLANVLPAHILWLVGLLPWTLALIAASSRPGHSRAVRLGVTPAMAAAREMARGELSWGRVFAVLSLLLWWLPVIGLGFAAVAYFLNRWSPTWTNRASQVGFVAAGLVHVALAVLFLVEMAKW